MHMVDDHSAINKNYTGIRMEWDNQSEPMAYWWNSMEGWVGREKESFIVTKYACSFSKSI